MKTFALIVVASTSVATAQPTRDETTGRIDYDHPGEQQRITRHRDGGWTELATPTETTHGTEFVMVGPEEGRFSQLRIVANDGRVEVRRVQVFFSDGTSRVFRIEKVIGRKHDRAVTIDLRANKSIEQVSITTSKDTRGTYSIYGT